MPKGDWSNTCNIHVQSMSFVYDDSSPRNITGIATAYTIMQPSGLNPFFNRVYTLPAPLPIGQWNVALQEAITDLSNYEGLNFA